MPLFRGVLAAAKRLRLDVESALAEISVDSDSDRRVPRGDLYRFWEILAGGASDATLGLHLAECAEPGDFAVLDYAMRNSPTLGEAYRQLSRYAHVLHNGILLFMNVEDGVAHMGYREPSGTPRQIAEWAVAVWLVTGRQIVGEEWRATSVTFQHRAPSDATEHARVFGCQPTFSSLDNSIAFDAALLDRPAVKADPQLFEVVSRFARELAEKVPRPETTSDHVKHVLGAVLSTQEASLEMVAKRLAVAPRTLQRKLKGEGASFQSLLDEVRCSLAMRYLGDSKLAVEETAFLLGFSEPSAFNRAFKRWTGAAPSAYRQ